MKSILCTLLFVGAVLCGRKPRANPPSFNDHDYTVSGELRLPYAEINEPFTAYFDISNQRSRVDYYGDLVLTVQRADLTKQFTNGVSYKIAYMVDKDGNPERVCFKVEGSNSSAVQPQPVLPDLSSFTFVKEEPCPGYYLDEPETCELWKYVVAYGEKKNEYSFWLTRDDDSDDDEAIPVQYTMKGYDSLLGSHYDEYNLVYHRYSRGPLSDSIFDVALNYTCRSFPGPGVEHVATHNPIKEFVNNHFQHLDDDFDDFKKTHKKDYKNQTEHEYRKSVFRHNYRYIHSMNRQAKTFKLKVNHLADFTGDELRYLRGRRTSNGFNGGLPFTDSVTKAPDQWDWRLLGAVNPVKDQAVCGSCWSFGTTGTIEGVYFVKTGHLVSLSEQQLIDCSWNQQNNGCDGGEDFRAYDYIMKAGGLSTDDEYGNYMGQDGKCHDKSVKKSVQLRGFVNVTSGSPSALKSALFRNGPVTVAIDASHKTFSFYANGVYYEPECGNKPEDLDHQVLAVGYGKLFGQDYWLIKNSWSTHWGNDGYVLMSQKNNNCGVMTSPTYPLIK